MSTSQKLEDEGVMEITGKVLIATIIALFFVLLLIFCFHIYARWLWHRRQQSPDYNNNNNARVQNSAAAGITVLRRGLDNAFLKTIPVLHFESKDFKDGLECSVCLSELVDGEKTRILPKCNHVFHAECIDMWFHSHSTCPICRNPVSEEQTQVSVDSLLLIQQNQQQQQQQQESNNNDGDSFPTNVLFWGDETQVSTLTSQLGELQANNIHMHSEPTTASSTSSSSHTNIINDNRMKPDLVIHIPTATATQHLVRNDDDDDQTSTPIMASFRRILSSSRRFSPFSPSPNHNINN